MEGKLLCYNLLHVSFVIKMMLSAFDWVFIFVGLRPNIIRPTQSSPKERKDSAGLKGILLLSLVLEKAQSQENKTVE